MSKLILFLSILPMLAIVINLSDDYPTKTEATRENLLEDATIDLLQPQMYSAVKEYYGSSFEIGFMCMKVNKIIKLEHPGSWYFEIELEGVTFTGPHTPMDIFTITINKTKHTNGKWVLKDYKVRKFDLEGDYECREPA